MHMKKTTLALAISSVICFVDMNASAATLVTGDVINFTAGAPALVACNYGSLPPCTNPMFQISDIVGSYFAFDINYDGVFSPYEKTPIAMFNGLIIGVVQDEPISSGISSHEGSINGVENPGIDMPWTYFANTGMHYTDTGPTVTSSYQNSAGGFTQLLDFSGWNITWDGVNVSANGDSLSGDTGLATLTCDGAFCDAGMDGILDSNFVLDYTADLLDSPFVANYCLHLESGNVANAQDGCSTIASPSSVPVPASIWLFGSGILGLVGISRRKKET